MNILKQTLIILLAAGVIVLGGLGLAETNWADGMRGETAVQAEGMETPEREGLEDMPASMNYVAPFFKELIMMGIPGIITLTIYNLTKRRGRSKRNRVNIANRDLQLVQPNR